MAEELKLILVFNSLADYYKFIYIYIYISNKTAKFHLASYQLPDNIFFCYDTHIGAGNYILILTLIYSIADVSEGKEGI